VNEVREDLQQGLTVLASQLYEIRCLGETTQGKDHPNGVFSVSDVLPLGQETEHSKAPAGFPAGAKRSLT
jgi:hypothetical protein